MFNCQRVVNQGVDSYWTLGGWDYQPKKKTWFLRSRGFLKSCRSPVVSMVVSIRKSLVIHDDWMMTGGTPLTSETSVFPKEQNFLSPLFLLWAPSGHVELLEIQQWPTCLIETSICKWECSLPAIFFVSHHQVCGQHDHLIKLNNIKNVVGPRNNHYISL